MSFSHPTHLSRVPKSTRSNVSAISLNNAVFSLLVDVDLAVDVYYKLSRNFPVTEFSSDLDIRGFDAIFIDCRGAEIRCPYENLNNRPNMTLALVDENSYLPQHNDQHKSDKHNVNLELTTEAELDSAVLKLRMEARVQQISQSAKSAKSEYAVADVVKENAYEILQVFAQNSTDLMAFKDLDHRFMVVSERFLLAEQLSLEQVIGKNDLEIGTSEELVLGNADKGWKGYWQLDDEVVAGKEASISEHLIVQENALDQIHEHVAKVPVKNAAGEVIGLVVCITQTHNSKQKNPHNAEIRSRANLEISPIIRKLDAEKNKALAISKQSQTAFKRKNNFIATASHDLRQPLQAIGLFIESLEHQIVDKGQLCTLKKMKQSSNDLSELLNSILDISKLDSDAVRATKTNFCISSLLKSVEDEFETEATRKSLGLHISSTNSIVHTDSLLLERVLRNLVSNAVKYTKTGTVNLVTELDGDSLLIHIKDSGPGIPKEQYAAIFDEYHQLEDNSSQPNFGMGLGLSIVKRLSDLLNLDIKLDSKIGHGTSFTLTVPLGDKSVQPVDQIKEGKVESIEPYKLLIVEDNPVVLDAMQEMLTGMNCDAYPASDITEALEIINELDALPDLVISDYQLADGITGDTAIEKICEAANETLPAIIVTGNTNNSLFREASKSAYRVLTKPVNPDVLLKTVISAVSSHREKNSKEPCD